MRAEIKDPFKTILTDLWIDVMKRVLDAPGYTISFPSWTIECLVNQTL